MRRVLWVVMVGALALPSVGCRRIDATSVGSRVSWDWSSFPETNVLLLEISAGVVVPVATRRITAPESGTIHLAVDAPTSRLGRGTVWAHIRPLGWSPDDERAELQAEREALELRWRKSQEVEMPLKRMDIERRMATKRREIQVAEVLAEALANAAMTLQLPDPGPRSALERELALLESERELLLAADDHGFKAELSRLSARERRLREREASLTLAMPFDGLLTLAPGLSDQGKEISVASGTSVAVCRDDSAVVLKVVSRAPLGQSPPASQVTARALVAGIEEALPAVFLREVIEEKNAGGYERVSYWAVASPTKWVVGSHVRVELLASLDAGVFVVPKFELVLRHPHAFRQSNWAEGIRQLCGGRLVAEGAHDLAVAKP